MSHPISSLFVGDFSFIRGSEAGSVTGSTFHPQNSSHFFQGPLGQAQFNYSHLTSFYMLWGSGLPLWFSCFGKLPGSYDPTIPDTPKTWTQTLVEIKTYTSSSVFNATLTFFTRYSGPPTVQTGSKSRSTQHLTLEASSPASTLVYSSLHPHSG